MQMSLNMHERSNLETVGFINTNYLLVCVQLVSARLINTDFFVLTHTLNFSPTKEFRAFSTHRLINEAPGLVE